MSSSHRAEVCSASSSQLWHLDPEPRDLICIHLPHHVLNVLICKGEHFSRMQMIRDNPPKDLPASLFPLLSSPLLSSPLLLSCPLLSSSPLLSSPLLSSPLLSSPLLFIVKLGNTWTWQATTELCTLSQSVKNIPAAWFIDCKSPQTESQAALTPLPGMRGVYDLWSVCCERERGWNLRRPAGYFVVEKRKHTHAL